MSKAKRRLNNARIRMRHVSNLNIEGLRNVRFSSLRRDAVLTGTHDFAISERGEDEIKKRIRTSKHPLDANRRVKFCVRWLKSIFSPSHMW